MKGRNTTNLELASYDDIFQTDEGREDALREKVTEIPLAELHSFERHDAFSRVLSQNWLANKKIVLPHDE